MELQLINFVQAWSALETPIGPETDLLTTNVLDSLLLMELVIVIEHNWQVRLQGKDIAPQNFRSIRNLAALIKSRQPEKPDAESVAA